MLVRLIEQFLECAVKARADENDRIWRIWVKQQCSLIRWNPEFFR